MEEQLNSIYNDDKQFLINYATEHHWTNYVLNVIRESTKNQMIKEIVDDIKSGEEWYELEVNMLLDD